MSKEEVVYEATPVEVRKVYVVQTKTGRGDKSWTDRTTFPVDNESSVPALATVTCYYSAKGSADEFARRGLASRVVLREEPV